VTAERAARRCRRFACSSRLVDVDLVSRSAAHLQKSTPVAPCKWVCVCTGKHKRQTNNLAGLGRPHTDTHAHARMHLTRGPAPPESYWPISGGAAMLCAATDWPHIFHAARLVHVCARRSVVSRQPPESPQSAADLPPPRAGPQPSITSRRRCRHLFFAIERSLHELFDCVVSFALPPPPLLLVVRLLPDVVVLSNESEPARNMNQIRVARVPSRP
jgi:hypothetical protein